MIKGIRLAGECHVQDGDVAIVMAKKTCKMTYMQLAASAMWNMIRR
jgi:hypothetical protein